MSSTTILLHCILHPLSLRLKISNQSIPISIGFFSLVPFLSKFYIFTEWGANFREENKSFCEMCEKNLVLFRKTIQLSPSHNFWSIWKCTRAFFYIISTPSYPSPRSNHTTFFSLFIETRSCAFSMLGNRRELSKYISPTWQYWMINILYPRIWFRWRIQHIFFHSQTW